MTDTYPQPIGFADVKVGMRVRITTVCDNGDSVVQTGTVIARTDIQVSVSAGSDVGPEQTYELMEAYTGDPNEPAIGSLIRSAAGVSYERLGDDPAVSAWYRPGSTDPHTWSDLTTDAPPFVVLQNGAN